jgi:glycosidase
MRHLLAISAIFCLNLSVMTLSLSAQDAEIMYHVVQRSFYDSDGDQHGDLNGLRKQIPYLKELGVTSVLLLPLYESIYYHNYFANDFEAIDPEFGSMKDYLKLVKALHKNDLKIYMDMEIQYLTEDHVWYKDSYQNPASEYSDYIVYNEEGNNDPESIIFDITHLEGYDGKKQRLATIDLHNPKVQAYMRDLFLYWVDPNGDGKFNDGIDGFRIDHMMDDLDWKGKWTNLLSEFWQPLFAELKKVNPDLCLFGEQAEWQDYGESYFAEAEVDRMFAFRIEDAIHSLDKQTIINRVDSTRALTPAGKDQILFIENHDTKRYASAVKNDPHNLRVGAALMFLLEGVPSIYYGQEIGMMGEGGFGAFGQSDANDIPRREAFEWYAETAGKGMSAWYANTGPWWDQRNLKANDGISVEEQRDDPHSLWNFYRDLIELRKTHSSIANGNLEFVENDHPKVLSFIREDQGQSTFITVALEPVDALVQFDLEDSVMKSLKSLGGDEWAYSGNSKLKVKGLYQVASMSNDK